MDIQTPIEKTGDKNKSFRVLLLIPNSNTHYVVPSVGLGYLAAVVRNAGFQVNIIDALKDNLSLNNLIVKIKDFSPTIIGIQVFSYDYLTVKEYVSRIRETIPETTIILGGAHVSGVGSSVLDQFKESDFAISGEAELGLPELVKFIAGRNQVQPDSIPGLIYRSIEGIKTNPASFVHNLDELPFPAWDLMDPRTYPDNPQGAFYKRFPIAPIITSRGCPYLCTYCGSHTISGRKIRKRSIKSVLDEMEILYRQYGVKEFHIIDDTFASYANRVKEFCQGLHDRNMDITFTFPNGVRLDTLTQEMLIMMKQSGLYAFTVGIESGSQRILDHMKKRLTLEKIRNKVQLIHDVGLEPNGFFIIGYPAETLEDIYKTIQFAKELPLKRAHFSNFLPLPGTEATKHLFQAGQINNIDFSQLFYSKVPYSPPGISPKELKKLQQKAFLSFHLRPRILLGLIRDIKSWSHMKIVAKRCIDYLFKR